MYWNGEIYDTTTLRNLTNFFCLHLQYLSSVSLCDQKRILTFHNVQQLIRDNKNEDVDAK